MKPPIAGEPYRKESFQQILARAMTHTDVGTACSMISQLCNRGALDLLERDDQGCCLLDRFSAQVAVSQEVLDTIELLGGSGCWSKPFAGRLLVMENMERWLGEASGVAQSNASHRIGPKKAGQVMQAMAARVDRSWFGLEIDGGASLVGRLVGRGAESLGCVQACWDAGVDPHARLADGTLAVAGIPRLDYLEAWMTVGGDINAPVKLGEPTPMWQHVGMNLQRATYSSLVPKLRELFQGEVRRADLDKECAFWDMWSERTNQGSVLRHLLSIENWHQEKRPGGTPLWLSAAWMRPDLLENFMDRKRSRPDFSQRDEAGRGAWYALLGLESQPHFQALAAKLENEVCLQSNGRDTRGRGLLVQVVEEAGGLAGLADKKPIVKYRLDNLMQLLAQDQVNTAVVLDGINELDFKTLDGSAGQAVAAKLFTSDRLVAALEGPTAIELAQKLFAGRPTDTDGNFMHGAAMGAVCRNVQQVALMHGPSNPGNMQQWLEMLGSWDTSDGGELRAAAALLRPRLEAIIEQAGLDDQVRPAPRAPGKTGPRL